MDEITGPELRSLYQLLQLEAAISEHHDDRGVAVSTLARILGWDHEMVRRSIARLNMVRGCVVRDLGNDVFTLESEATRS